MYVCMYVCVCVYVCMYVCVYVCMYVCMYTMYTMYTMYVCVCMREFEWRFYALLASKAIFRVITYSHIRTHGHIQAGNDDCLVNETKRKPTTGR